MFIWKLFSKFFCTVTFKNVQIFYQNSIAASETMFTLKRRRLLPRQRAQVLLEVNKRIPTRYHFAVTLAKTCRASNLMQYLTEVT